MSRPRKRFCPRGHDKNVPGAVYYYWTKTKKGTRVRARRCVQCMSLLNQRRRESNDIMKDMVAALESMLKAYEQLMPGLKNIAIQDYANINEAPILARKALQRGLARMASGDD